MKTTRSFVVGAALAFITYSSFATSPYDGIYADMASANSYVSVHTNADQMIVTQYEILPASGVLFTSQLGSVMPRQVNTWQLLQGTLTGSTASLSGQLMFNQCNVRLNATFTNTSLVATVTSASSSGAGTSSTMNCPALTTLGPLRFNKIF